MDNKDASVCHFRGLFKNRRLPENRRSIINTVINGSNFTQTSGQLKMLFLRCFACDWWRNEWVSNQTSLSVYWIIDNHKQIQIGTVPAVKSVIKSLLLFRRKYTLDHLFILQSLFIKFKASCQIRTHVHNHLLCPQTLAWHYGKW